MHKLTLIRFGFISFALEKRKIVFLNVWAFYKRISICWHHHTLKGLCVFDLMSFHNKHLVWQTYISRKCVIISLSWFSLEIGLTLWWVRIIECDNHKCFLISISRSLESVRIFLHSHFQFLLSLSKRGTIISTRFK